MHQFENMTPKSCHTPYPQNLGNVIDIKKVQNQELLLQSKYIKYLQVNPSLGTPKIYKSVNRHSDVSMVAGLRTSSHNLQIEMGRRTRTPREDRKCLCGEVEDEDHFALSCDLYADIRRKHNVLTSTEISCMFDNDRHVEYLNELYKRRKELKQQCGFDIFTEFLYGLCFKTNFDN